MSFVKDNNYFDISVICTTYNHYNHIERAIRSIVSQKTRFTFNLILSDDASNDGTSDICKKLAAQYPDKILYFRHEKNIGLINNYLFSFKKATKSRYIAYCDGDDYWCDLEKLEIQTSFMDNNPQYSLTYHDDILSFEREIDYEVYSKRIAHPNLFEVYDKHFISAPSIMARNFLSEEHFKIIQYAGSGDIALFGLATVFGDIGFIDRKMSVYTLTEGAQTSKHFKNIEREFSNLVYILMINKIYKKGFNYLLLDKTIRILKDNAVKISMLRFNQRIKIKIKNISLLFNYIPTNIKNRTIIITKYLFNATYN